MNVNEVLLDNMGLIKNACRELQNTPAGRKYFSLDDMIQEACLHAIREIIPKIDYSNPNWRGFLKVSIKNSLLTYSFYQAFPIRFPVYTMRDGKAEKELRAKNPQRQANYDHAHRLRDSLKKDPLLLKTLSFKDPPITELKDEVAFLTKDLTEMEKETLSVLFGLETGKPLSIKEAAEKIGVPAGTLANRRSQALKKIRRLYT